MYYFMYVIQVKFPYLFIQIRNSVAYFDKQNQNFDKAAVFMASNEVELVSQKPKRRKYEVSLDECQVADFYGLFNYIIMIVAYNFLLKNNKIFSLLFTT